MARKKNQYSNLDVFDVKIELERNIRYIDSIDINDLADEIEIDYSAYGQNMIQIVERLEEKIMTLILLIKDSILQLQYIANLTEADEYLEDNLNTLKESLKIISEYYETRPPESFDNRRKEIIKKKKNGDSYTISKIIANKSKQIKARVSIQKVILELKPVIANLETRREEEITLKGDKEIPLALRLRGLS